MNKNNNIIISGPHKDFESIKKVDENGVEYWDARELMPLLGYEQWRRFEETISRAQTARLNSGQDVKNHFADVGKMVEIGSGTVREVADFRIPHVVVLTPPVPCTQDVGTSAIPPRLRNLLFPIFQIAEHF